MHVMHNISNRALIMPQIPIESFLSIAYTISFSANMHGIHHFSIKSFIAFYTIILKISHNYGYNRSRNLKMHYA